MYLKSSLAGLLLLVLVYGMEEKEKPLLSSMDIESTIKDWHRRKCLKNADLNVYEELVSASVSSGKCFDKAFPSNLEVSRKPKYVCGQAIPVAYECYVSYLKVFKRCLDPNREQYIPSMMIDFFNGTTHELCKYQNDHEEYTKNYQLLEATYYVLFFGDIFNTCLSNTNLVKNINLPDLIIEKQSICNDMDLLKQCLFGKIPRKNGEEYELITNSITTLFNNYMASCQFEGSSNDI